MKLLEGCHQSQNVTVLAILERLEFKTFSCRPTMVAGNALQSSMITPLSNPIRRPWNNEVNLCSIFSISTFNEFYVCASSYF